jgi:hypothetical protein
MSYEITLIGGQCPVQAEGYIVLEEKTYPFYFRSRGDSWTFYVGIKEPLIDTIWSVTERYGNEGSFDAGVMPLTHAKTFIFMCVARFKKIFSDNNVLVVDFKKQN